MKKIITTICVIAFMLSLAGCGNNTENKENGSDLIINETTESTMQDNETNSDNSEKLPDGTTEDSTDVERKDGDILEDGTTYFSTVEIVDNNSATEFLDKYAHELNKNLVLFTTPEYTGRVERLDNEYIIKKESDKFESVVFIYGENTSTHLTEFDDNGNVKYEYIYATNESVYTKKYYSENLVRVEQFKNDGSDEIYSLAEFERGIINGSEYRVLVRAEYMNNVHMFEYSDKINDILSSMTVVEGGDYTYTFIMDGSGNNPENVVSLTMTKNGKTTKYDSGNIPWYSVASPPGLMQSFSY